MKQQINIYLEKEILEMIDKHLKGQFKKRSVWIRELIIKEVTQNLYTYEIN